MIFAKIQVLLASYLVVTEQFLYAQRQYPLYNATWYKYLHPNEFVNGGSEYANVCRGADEFSGVIRVGYAETWGFGCCYVRDTIRVCGPTVEYLHNKDNYKWSLPTPLDDYAVVGEIKGSAIVLICLTTLNNGEKYVGMVPLRREAECCVQVYNGKYQCNSDYEVLVHNQFCRQGAGVGHCTCD